MNIFVVMEAFRMTNCSRAVWSDYYLFASWWTSLHKQSKITLDLFPVANSWYVVDSYCDSSTLLSAVTSRSLSALLTSMDKMYLSFNFPLWVYVWNRLLGSSYLLATFVVVYMNFLQLGSKPWKSKVSGLPSSPRMISPHQPFGAFVLQS